ncbi:hypothetical protein NE237_022658 [Protea cynaroides]|uniref:Uncharacterized protein n=1 Tax=Protea cynaroides TaxID=273540 RepID=A0A9Q0K3R6_9MAGN|nr:hypothetical protein NE237_022658 [Protea cynaroides]
MARVVRLLRTSKLPQNFYFPSSYSFNLNLGSLSSSRCLIKAGVITREKGVSAGNGERKISAVTGKASVVSESMISTEPQAKTSGVGQASLTANITETALRILRPDVKRIPWRLQTEMLMETAVIDCRFFTLFAVAGSLLGSILCFFEGCALILESYFSYYHMMLQHSNQGHRIEILFEAIDMFLLGTAMLIFGTGLYVFFVGSKDTKRGGTRLTPQSNFFGLFHLHKLPSWVEMQSVAQEKSKFGHAVLMILQVGVLEKFKNIPLVTGLDLACFAGAVLVSSASIFLLSRLSMVEQKVGRNQTTWFARFMGQK